jgi:hypothetical protein
MASMLVTSAVCSFFEVEGASLLSERRRRLERRRLERPLEWLLERLLERELLLLRE